MNNIGGHKSTSRYSCKQVVRLAFNSCLCL